MRIVVNMIMGDIMNAFSEGLVLSKRSGLSPHDMEKDRAQNRCKHQPQNITWTHIELSKTHKSFLRGNNARKARMKKHSQTLKENHYSPSIPNEGGKRLNMKFELSYKAYERKDYNPFKLLLEDMLDGFVPNNMPND
ncbi:unnamed protein product [Dovyalis caffra]|uniref:Ycf1 n=1 Tax=Dovyalis caffra TaxID=77055 RepID=A0AAV1SKB5_9ROSI|nr:unnamed protein product [Dovyalis caffra]